MVIGLLQVRLLIRDSNSLKDKRSVLKRTIHRLRTGFNCAVAEVDDQDIWRSAVLAIVTVYSQRDTAQALLDDILAELDAAADFEVIERAVEWL